MEMVIVLWIDISKTTSDSSFDVTRNIDDRLSEMKTIGWLYRESDKVILLVQEFSDGKPGDYITIPKCLILNIMLIREA